MKISNLKINGFRTEEKMTAKLKAFLLSLLLIAACSPGNESGPAAKPTPFRVKLQPVQRRDMSRHAMLYGVVTLRRQAFLASQFDGRLSEFMLLPGNHVRRGEQIGLIIPPLREALLHSETGSSQEITEVLQNQMRKIVLTSPISGEILAVYRQNGDVVQSGEHIAEIGDISLLDVRVELPLRYLSAVSENQVFTVHFIDFPHKDLQLYLEAIVGMTDESRQTVPLRLRLNNPEGLFRPGMKVKIDMIVTRHEQTLTVPRIALVEEEGVFSVFIFLNGKVSKRKVQPGIFTEAAVEIIDGLNDSDKVVTGKVYSLVDGMEVTPR